MSSREPLEGYDLHLDGALVIVAEFIGVKDAYNLICVNQMLKQR